MSDEDRAAPAPAKWLADTQIAWPRKPWLAKPRSGAPRWLIGAFGFRIAFPGMDAAYRRQRLTLTRVRRAVATVATSRKRLELEIARLDGQDRATTETLADLRRQYVDLQAREERITRASRRLQAEIVNFKAARESVQAAYTAAEVAANAAWAEMTAPWL
jgi:hypothetical protein